jgi:predicted metal-dependent phosphoesterase TrpH
MNNYGKRATWSKIDLHIHTRASDGSDTPSAVVRLAAERGIRIIGITDHDTTEGLDEALSTLLR